MSQLPIVPVRHVAWEFWSSGIFALSSFVEMKPWQTLVRKDVPRRLELGGLLECADMEMHFRRTFTFTRQG